MIELLKIQSETALQDLRYGARMIYRNPGFTAVAILALAIGIGVNTAVFTAWKAMVARPLDASNPGRMVNIALNRATGASDFLFSYPDYQAYRDTVHSFSGLIAFRPEQMTLLNAGGVLSQRNSAARSFIGRFGLLSPGAGNTEFASVFVVSGNYFRVLGVDPLRGRTFESMSVAELRASPSILISENYWHNRFAGDAAILGKVIRLNGTAVTVAGITPHDFVGTGIAVPDFWLPLSLEPLIHADDGWLADHENRCCRLFGRLANGAVINQAKSEMTLAANHIQTLHDTHSKSAEAVTAIVWPGSPFPLPLSLYGGLKLTILLIMAAAAMVLAVACANVASLQLARIRSRRKELRTRLSLGAGRFRLIRQLLTESALTGLLAGVVALLFTSALLKLLASLISQALPAEYGTLIFDVNPDLAVFAYVFGISLVSGILFGLAPAIESSRSPLNTAVKAGTSPLGNRRLQDALIAAQVALSLTLLIAGSILIRSSMKSLDGNTGYDAKHVLDFEVGFPETPAYTAARKAALINDLRRRLAAVPGIAATTSARPPAENGFRTAAQVLNAGQSSARDVQSILHYTYVQANYFRTLGIPLLLGSTFQSQAGEPGHSVILSESAATHLWPARNPIGRSLRLGATDEKFHNPDELIAGGPAFQVIGVARDTRGVEFDGSDASQVYLPLPEDRLVTHPILIRTYSDTAPVVAALDPLVSAVDPNLIGSASTLEGMLRRTAPFIVSSLSAAVASSIGLLGLLLSSMGIYGTVSYIVTLRTRELGIRIAVGARKSDILRLILFGSARPVLAGLAAGILLAAGTSYLLRALLFGLSAADATSYLAASSLFLAIAILAAYPPARRATYVDPAVALRYE